MRLIYSLFLALALATPLLAAEPEIGKTAPSLKMTATDGKLYDLAKLKGKIVVLEWTNSGCPVVGKHYDSGNMQGLQKKYTAQGVVWLSVVSSAKGLEGWFEDNAAALAWLKKREASPTALIRDIDGKLGHAYGAKATPHMFVIDKKGLLVYKGAIDDKPSAQGKDIAGARNWVAEAIDALIAGKKVAVAETRAYGCRVKYAD